MQLIIKSFTQLTNQELYAILKARTEIFVVEQNCVYCDMDDKDQGAWHVFLWDEDGIVAYARVLDKGVAFDEVAIGRMICTKRRHGYAQQVLNACFTVAKEKYNADVIRIHAQKYVRSLYEKVGFVVDSEPFLEDGIPHIEMIKRL